jgi:hypothetical protein
MSQESIEAIFQHACEGAAESIGSTRTDWQRVVDAIRELRAQVAALTAERDALQTDAARYRWVRDGERSTFEFYKLSEHTCFESVMDEYVDGCIDAELNPTET